MKQLTSVFIVVILAILCGAINGHAASSNQLIIINKATNRLAFYDSGKLVSTFMVATGRSDSYTPEGTFQIVNKIKNRPYYTDNIPGGDPRNPLGDRWLGLDARGTYGTTYAIHGNSNPASIGTYASAGCVRMYDDEVQWLFDHVDLYTNVVITNTNATFESIAASHGYSSESQLTAVTVDQASPQKLNTPVTIKASSTNNKQSLYRFLEYDGTKWNTLKEFSHSNSLNWQPNIPGAYQLKVQVKHKSSTNNFDDEKVIPFDIYLPASIETFEINKQSPTPINTKLSLSLTTKSKENLLVQYSIFDGDEWSTIQSYTHSLTTTWEPQSQGTYKVRVRVKHQLSTSDFDDEKIMDYTVYEPATFHSITTDKDGPQPVTTSVHVSSLTNNDRTNLFKFSVLDDSDSDWKIVQDYSSDKSFKWNPIKSGSYQLKVETKHAQSPGISDDEKIIPFTIFEPASLNSDPSHSNNLVQINKSINLSVELKPENLIKFSINDGVGWKTLQGYSPNGEFSWKPTKPGAYKIRIEIKHLYSKQDFDDVQEFPYIVYKSVLEPAIVSPSIAIKRRSTIVVKGLRRRKQ